MGAGVVDGVVLIAVRCAERSVGIAGGRRGKEAVVVGGVLVVARPAVRARDTPSMRDLLDVADLVVGVALGVVEEGLERSLGCGMTVPGGGSVSTGCMPGCSRPVALVRR